MIDKIIELLNSKTEDNEMVQGDVVSYVPDWEFKEIAGEIVKLFTIPLVRKRKWYDHFFIGFAVGTTTVLLMIAMFVFLFL